MSNNIFGNSDKNQTEFKDKVETHSKAILTVIQQQKDIESNVDLLDEKIRLLDHNAIKNFKKLFDEIRNIKIDIRDIKSDMEDLREFNKKVTKQLRMTASTDEVKRLEKYIDLWNPMDFVTREEFNEHNEELKNDLEELITNFMVNK